MVRKKSLAADEQAGEMIILTEHRILEGQSRKLTALNASIAFQRRVLERFFEKSTPVQA